MSKSDTAGIVALRPELLKFPNQVHGNPGVRTHRVVVVQDADKFFTDCSTTELIKRVIEVLSWTDWWQSSEIGRASGGGLLVCFPDSYKFIPNAPTAVNRFAKALELVALDFPYDLTTRFHLLEGHDGELNVTVQNDGGIPVSADIVCNSGPGTLRYKQMINDVTWSRYCLRFLNESGDPTYPAGALMSGTPIERNEQDPSPTSEVVVLFPLNGEIGARAYRLHAIDTGASSTEDDPTRADYNNPAY